MEKEEKLKEEKKKWLEEEIERLEGFKEVYQDKTQHHNMFDVKEHSDSCCNETLSDVISHLEAELKALDKENPAGN